MSADLYEEIAAEYLSTARLIDNQRMKDFTEELAAEMVTLSNLARTNTGA